MPNHFDPRGSADDVLNFCCDAVKIFVGPDKDCFSLPRSVATSTSGFLQEWLSDNQDEIHIYRACPTATRSNFNTYANWLHTRTIPLTARAKAPRAGSGGQAEDRQSVELADLYALGAALYDEDFVNCVVDALIANFHEGHLPGITCIEIIYEWTVQRHRHRKLLAQAYAKLGNKSHFKVLRDKVPADFFVDLCVALSDVRDPDESTILVGSNCAFHLHFHTERCSDAGRPKKRARLEAMDAQTPDVKPLMMDGVDKSLPSIATNSASNEQSKPQRVRRTLPASQWDDMN